MQEEESHCGLGQMEKQHHRRVCTSRLQTFDENQKILTISAQGLLSGCFQSKGLIAQFSSKLQGTAVHVCIHWQSDGDL